MTSVRIRHVRLARDEAPAAEVATGSTLVFPRLPVRVRHGGDSFVADSTVAVLYIQPQRFERECLDARGVESDWIALPPDAVAEAVGRLRAARPPAIVLPCAMPTLLLERVILDELDSAADALWIDEAALLLLDRLLGQPAQPVSGAHAGLANAAKAIIARDPTVTMPLPDLAAAIGVSSFHLCRVFTAWAGLTLSAYRDQLRIRMALDELATGGVSTAALALRLGYRDPQVFRRRFRQLTGLTIADARRRTTSGKGPAIRKAVFAAAPHGSPVAPDR